MPETNNRSFGLDVLRSAAILIVLFVHSAYLAEPPCVFLPLPDGVDLFFVLSGYLVGRLFIRHVEVPENSGFAGLIAFLRRRWFRTLPNYFLFLLLNIALVYAGIASGQLNRNTFAYFVFLQNFHKPLDLFFWESWSLSVEEWFYLLFPLLAVALHQVFHNKKRPKQALGIATLIIILVPLCIRFYIGQSLPDFDLYIRKLVITRLDTIGYGLAGACICHYYSALWLTTKNLFFVLGCMGLMALQFADVTASYSLTCLYHSVTGICILMLLPMLSTLTAKPSIAKPFEFISRISYSLYLVHTPVLILLKHLFPFQDGYHPITFPLFWLFSFLLASLIYRYYERPLTDLRDKTIT